VLATLVAVLTVAAVRRGAWRSVGAAILIVGVTAVATTFLRDDVLMRPRLKDEAFPENSLPSTHVSVACALVVASVILWPRRPWWLINTACVVVLLAALGNVLGQAHRVSDVVASGSSWGQSRVSLWHGCARPESRPARRSSATRGWMRAPPPQRPTDIIRSVVLGDRRPCEGPCVCRSGGTDRRSQTRVAEQPVEPGRKRLGLERIHQ
jgi:hypothetical protein